MRQFYCSAYVNMLKILSLKLCDVWQNILPPNQPFSSRHSQPNHPHIGMDISKKKTAKSGYNFTFDAKCKNRISREDINAKCKKYKNDYGGGRREMSTTIPHLCKQAKSNEENYCTTVSKGVSHYSCPHCQKQGGEQRHICMYIIDVYLKM